MALYNLRTAQYVAKNPTVPAVMLAEGFWDLSYDLPVTRKERIAISSR
jgi:hypothetical protein